MKCIVINLERSVERRKLVIKEFEKLEVEFEIFCAQDWQNLNVIDYVKFRSNSYRLMYWDRHCVPAELACYMSHRQVWQSIIADDKCEIVAIFEDDVVLRNNFKRALKILESNRRSFDIVFLENRYPHRKFKTLVHFENDIALGMVKGGNIGATGYVITRLAMQQMINRFDNMPAQVDVLLHSSWLNGLRVFTLNPSSVDHRNNIRSCIESADLHHRRNRRIIRDLIFVSIPKRFMITIPKQINYYWRSIRKS